jgi:hypothetical protein
VLCCAAPALRLRCACVCAVPALRLREPEESWYGSLQPATTTARWGASRLTTSTRPLGCAVNAIFCALILDPSQSVSHHRHTAHTAPPCSPPYAQVLNALGGVAFAYSFRCGVLPTASRGCCTASSGFWLLPAGGSARPMVEIWLPLPAAAPSAPLRA